MENEYEDHYNLNSDNDWDEYDSTLPAPSLALEDSFDESELYCPEEIDPT